MMKFPKERVFWIGFSVILIIAGIGVFADNMNFRRASIDKQKELEGEIKDLEKKLMECNTQLLPVPSIDIGDINRLKEKGLQNPVVDLVDDLKQHKELIPLEAVLGGTMQFNEIHILTSKWVLASFEDGHIGGEILLEYKVSYEGNITWKVVASYRH